MSVGELAAFVCTKLRARGIDVVLSGGSCVSIYSAGRYVSNDLDFVEAGVYAAREIRAAMADLGFEREHRHYRHPDTAFLVEFPTGPLAVGKEPVASIHEIKFSTGVLRILSPTDCVKDRLAAYFHWKDRQCLEQAVLVAEANDVDVDEVGQWAKREGKSAEFRAIVKRLRPS